MEFLSLEMARSPRTPTPHARRSHVPAAQSSAQSSAQPTDPPANAVPAPAANPTSAPQVAGTGSIPTPGAALATSASTATHVPSASNVTASTGVPPASSTANNNTGATAPNGNVPAASNPNIVTTGLPDPDRFDRSFYPSRQRKFYAVFVGTSLGMHPDWPSAQAATSGFTGSSWKKVEWDDGIDMFRRNLADGNVHYPQPSLNTISRARALQRATSAPPAFNTGNPTAPPTAAPHASTVQPAPAAPQAYIGTPTRSNTTAPPMLTTQPTPSPGNSVSRHQTPRRLFQQRSTRVLSPIPDVIPETPLGSPTTVEAAASVVQDSPGHQNNPIYYSPSPTPGRPSNPITVGSTPARPAPALRTAPALQPAPASQPAPVPANASQPAPNTAPVPLSDPTRTRPVLRFVDRPFVPTGERQRHFTRPGFVPNRGGARRQPEYRTHPFTGRPVRVPDEFDEIDGENDTTDGDNDTDGSGRETHEGDVDGKGGEDSEDSEMEGEVSENKGEVDAKPLRRRAVHLRSCAKCGGDIRAPPRPMYSSVGTQTKKVFLLSALSSPEQGTNEANSIATDEEDYVTATDSTPSSGSSGSRSLKRKSPDADQEEFLPALPPRHVSGRRPFVRLFDSPEDGPARLPAYPRAHPGPPGLFEPHLLRLQRSATPASPASSVRSDAAVYGTSPARSSPPQLDSDTEYGHLTDYSDPILYDHICRACDEAQERYREAKRSRRRR